MVTKRVAGLVTKRLAAPKAKLAAAPPAPTAPPSPGAVEDPEAIAREIETERTAAAAKQRDQVKQVEKVEHASANSARAQAAAEIVQFLKPVRDMAEDTIAEFDKLPAGKLTEIWSDKRLEGIAEPLVSVIERHGDLVAKFMADWMPYMALAGATLLPMVVTVKAVRAHEAITVKSREVSPGPGNVERQQ